MIEKLCSKCKIIKPIERFGKSKKYKCGYRCECKDCRKNHYLSKGRKSNITGQGIDKIVYIDDIKMVYCSKCEQYKESENFGKSSSIYGSEYSAYCKQCKSNLKKTEQYKISEITRREKIKEFNKSISLDITKNKICAICKEEKNILAFGVDNKTKHGRQFSCKECIKIKIKSPEFKAKRNVYMKNRLDTNPQAKIKKLLRCRLNNMIRSKKCRKVGSSVELLGCTTDFLKLYLESQFLEDMTWDNWGTLWQLDHIKPMSYYDLENEEDLKELCNYTNLQPLYKDINNFKNDSIVDEQWYIDRGLYRKRDNLPVYTK